MLEPEVSALRAVQNAEKFRLISKSSSLSAEGKEKFAKLLASLPDSEADDLLNFLQITKEQDPSILDRVLTKISGKDSDRAAILKKLRERDPYTGKTRLQQLKSEFPACFIGAKGIAKVKFGR
jgi:predicted ATPase